MIDRTSFACRRVTIVEVQTVGEVEPVSPSVATTPTNLPAARVILDQLNQGLGTLLGSESLDNNLRQELAVQARDLTAALETPRETSIKHLWAEVSLVIPASIPAHAWVAEIDRY